MIVKKFKQKCVREKKKFTSPFISVHFQFQSRCFSISDTVIYLRNNGITLQNQHVFLFANKHGRQFAVDKAIWLFFSFVSICFGFFFCCGAIRKSAHFRNLISLYYVSVNIVVVSNDVVSLCYEIRGLFRVLVFLPFANRKFIYHDRHPAVPEPESGKCKQTILYVLDYYLLLFDAKNLSYYATRSIPVGWKTIRHFSHFINGNTCHMIL